MYPKSRDEWKDVLWEEMQAQERRKIRNWVVLISLVALLLAGYALCKGISTDYDLMMLPSSREQITYLEVSEDSFEGADFEIRFVVYDAELDWIQICLSAPKGTDMNRLPIVLDYYLDGEAVEHSFSTGSDTWLKSFEHIVIKDVGEFSELRLVWRGQSIVIRK